MYLKSLYKRPSAYGGLVIWGATGFMAQPTLASLAVHFFIVPLMIVSVLWLAFHEGWRAYKENR